LIIHQRSHTDKCPFACTECNRRFSQKGNLNRHQRVHTGKRPFIC
ncbi:Zinc finger protein 775, partial [Cuculus canorus]